MGGDDIFAPFVILEIGQVVGDSSTIDGENIPIFHFLSSNLYLLSTAAALERLPLNGQNNHGIISRILQDLGCRWPVVSILAFTILTMTMELPAASCLFEARKGSSQNHVKR